MKSIIKIVTKLLIPDKVTVDTFNGLPLLIVLNMSTIFSIQKNIVCTVQAGRTTPSVHWPTTFSMIASTCAASHAQLLNSDILAKKFVLFDERRPPMILRKLIYIFVKWKLTSCVCMKTFPVKLIFFFLSFLGNSLKCFEYSTLECKIDVASKILWCKHIILHAT